MTRDDFRRALAACGPGVDGNEARQVLLQLGLDDPGDPYGLAHLTEAALHYFSPMNNGEVFRCELVRRRRTRGAS